MGREDEYEGIDFREKPPQRIKSRSNAISWMLLAIAIINGLIILFQMRGSSQQVQRVSALEQKISMLTKDNQQMQLSLEASNQATASVQKQLGDKTGQLNDCQKKKHCH